jgi:hypothetical protein
VTIKRERAFRVMEWADLNGDDLASSLRLDPDDDAELLEIINDALFCAADLYYLLLAAAE